MSNIQIFAGSDIVDVSQTRLVLFNNGDLVHIPAQSLIKQYEQKIAQLETRIDKLEKAKNDKTNK